ncbi:MAG: hypothetical protein M5R42_12730 [Rhodocyclaceae bacterium]|nr:hypothetical protein [Rhodocyclaceae bacterium]
MINGRHPYSGLAPDVVLNALGRRRAALRRLPTGPQQLRKPRLQVGIEDAPSVVAKFYRPQRWRDAAILEVIFFA